MPVTLSQTRLFQVALPDAQATDSIQLMNDEKRWWVVTVFWQSEDDKNPLPKEYLGTKN
jgi:hypothetical protein